MGWNGRRRYPPRETQCMSCGEKYPAREACPKCERARAEATHYERAEGPVPEAIYSGAHSLRWTALGYAKADGIYWDALRATAHGDGFYVSELTLMGWRQYVAIRKEG